MDCPSSPDVYEGSEDKPGFLHFSGFGYWTASLFPVLVGTTLPFWLRPPGFSFRWFAAVEFLIATLLVHAGFSLLQALFEGRHTARWSKSRLLGAGGACIIAGCLLGLHLNSGLHLHSGVPGYIFIVYGLTALFAGVLYVAPPFNFSRRIGGEIILAQGFGFIPILGAYLVQVGDITRRVYLAATLLVAATWLWVWIDELVTRVDDEKTGHGTMVIMFGSRFSGRFVVPVLCIGLYTSLFLAVFTRSIFWVGLIALLLLGFAWRIIVIAWRWYESPARMREARRKAFILHLAMSLIVIASSLAALLR